MEKLRKLSSKPTNQLYKKKKNCHNIMLLTSVIGMLTTIVNMLSTYWQPVNLLAMSCQLGADRMLII